MQTETDEWELEEYSLPLPFEEHWLPRRPYAAPAKHGPYYRTSRERAMTMPYIEANPTVMRSLIITDHDGGRADEIVGLVGLPVPSWISLNPHTKCGHIGYAIGEPICLSNAARRAPVNLMARIEAGLDSILGGDVAYGRRITKNPRHEDHLTLWGPEHAVYRLKDLADPIEELGALPRWNGVRDRRQKLERTDTGRNVELFEVSRKWAYPRRGDYTDLGRWRAAVDDYAWDRNIDLIGPNFTRGPLEAGEVHQIARSISAWTWRNITRSLSEEQSRRGRLGGLATAAKMTPEQRKKRGQRAGKTMTEAKREANRQRATKLDASAIIAAALEV